MKIIDIEGNKYLKLSQKEIIKLNMIIVEDDSSQKPGSFVYNLSCILSEAEDFIKEEKKE